MPADLNAEFGFIKRGFPFKQKLDVENKAHTGAGRVWSGSGCLYGRIPLSPPSFLGPARTHRLHNVPETPISDNDIA